ncbi:hypothetical protein [Pseudomonas phage GP100]|nr:hypothetical protein [Pseudomonas phage GP100]
MAKKQVQWHIVNGDGKLLWDEEDFYRTRNEARKGIQQIKRDIFRPWCANVTLPLKILRREWMIVDEREVR